MKIGLLLPISWAPLADYIPDTASLPKPLEFFFGAQLAAELRRRGHEVHVFTLSYFTSEEAHVHGDGMWVHVGPYRHHVIRRMLTGFAAERDVLRGMMARYPCDVYHAHWCYEFARPVVESGLPHVVTMHDNPWRVLMLFRPKSYRFCRLLLSYYVLSRASHLSAVSPYMASYCRRVHHRKDVRLIPNALALPCGLEPKERVGSAERVVFVEMANGWKGCKNIPNLIRAFARLRGMTAKSCELHIYGVGNEPDGETVCWARRKGISLDGIVFYGQVPHDDMLREINDKAHVFIHASREESFGLVIIEAMALGLTTIVGAKSGAAPWVAGDGRTGLLVDVNDVDAMANAMKRLAENEGARREFGQTARQEFLRRFTLKTVTDQYEALYREVLRG